MISLGDSGDEPRVIYDAARDKHCAPALGNHFQPPSSACQRRLCAEFALRYVRQSAAPGRLPEDDAFSNDQKPAKTARIDGDGNCYFRSLSYILTGIGNICTSQFVRRRLNSGEYIYGC